MTRKYTGQCACGAVRFAFDIDPNFVANCHCLDCKRATGGEAATFFAVPQDDFTVISGSPKAFHYKARGSTATFAPTAAPDCSAATSRASPASSS